MEEPSTFQTTSENNEYFTKDSVRGFKHRWLAASMHCTFGGLIVTYGITFGINLCTV